MPDRPVISIVTPTFNRREVLARALESGCGQTVTDFEHVVVADGSEDGSVKHESADSSSRRRTAATRCSASWPGRSRPFQPHPRPLFVIPQAGNPRLPQRLWQGGRAGQAAGPTGR